MYCSATSPRTLEPSAISTERRCSSHYRFRTAGTQNTCPAAAPMAAGSPACYVQAGDVGLPLACRNCTGLYLSDECHLTSSVGVRSLRSADSWTCVYLVAHTMATVFAGLPLRILVCGTDCLPLQLRKPSISFNHFITVLKTLLF